MLGGVKVDPGVNFFGLTNYRNQNRRFGIKTDDRRRHMYIVGKTGMGKTTILENMVLNDIYGGHGVGLVDPHGDFAEKIIDFIPPHRINDVVYFNPSDIDYPIGFNILETINPEQKHLVASGLMGVFKKIWPDVWSARMEYILNNTILALLDFPGTTLLGINRMLADEEYRKRVVANTKDPVIKAYWQTEFANYTEKFRSEAVSPIQNKIGQFLSASVIRNIVAQVKSRINIREIMDTQKILIMNLSKGRIGEDNSRLLGGMLITRIQLAAMERVDIPEKDRKDFFLYVDEFQNFATESFANILSEARKYRLDLIMAHQYMEQLDEMVLAAVIGNVGTMVTFRVGSSDAEILAKEFSPTFVEEDLVNLPKYHTYLKLMIDGVASRPFSALTLPPIGSSTASTEKVVRVSRERYAVPKDKIEDKIARWSGMVVMSDEEASMMEVDEDEVSFKEPAKKAPEQMAASQPKPGLVSLQPSPRPPQAPVQQPRQPAASAPSSAPASGSPAGEPRRVPSTSQPRSPQGNQPRPGNTNQNMPRPAGTNRSDQRSAQSAPAGRQGGPGGLPGGQNSQSGNSESRNRNKNKKNRTSSPPPPSASILLGDPGQKGISLTSMLPKQPVADDDVVQEKELIEAPAQPVSAPRVDRQPEPGFASPPALDLSATSVVSVPTSPSVAVDPAPIQVSKEVETSRSQRSAQTSAPETTNKTQVPVSLQSSTSLTQAPEPTVLKPGAVVTFDDTTLE